MRAAAGQRRLRHLRLVELEDRAAEDLHRLGAWRHVGERVTQPADGAGVELRHAGFVDADLGADLLHRRLLVVVEADDLLLAGRERLDRRLDPAPRVFALERHIRPLRLGGDQSRRQRRFVEVIVVGQRGGRFDGVDADDGAAQALFVGANFGGQVGQRWLASELATELLARRLQLTALTAHPARPGVLAKRIDHRAANPPFGERLELDAARLVEAVRGIDQADDAVLDEVADVYGVGHRGRHASSELFDEGNAVDDAGVVGGELGAHLVCNLQPIPKATGVPKRAASVIST